MKTSPKKGMFPRPDKTRDEHPATGRPLAARASEPEPVLALTDNDLEFVVGGLAKPMLPSDSVYR